VLQAWREVDAADAPGRYRSKQCQHRSHHKKKFHANLQSNEHRIGDRTTKIRAVQRIPPGDWKKRSVLVPVVQIRVVRVHVAKYAVVVGMRVGFRAIPPDVVAVLMVFIVGMDVNMIELFMTVLVSVKFGQVQPDAARH
jgi:hypothetical protein